MKQFKVIFSEVATYSVVVTAEDKEKAREQVENEYPISPRCLYSSWKVESVEE